VETVIQLVATDTTVVIVFSAVTGLALALTTAFVAWIFFAVFEGSEENVRDVQRFTQLTDEARALLPSGLPLLDPDGGTEASAAITRFLAKKEEARKALWESRQRTAEELAGETPQAPPQPADEGKVARSRARPARRRSALIPH
jgi:hypothetical protein